MIKYFLVAFLFCVTASAQPAPRGYDGGPGGGPRAERPGPGHMGPGPMRNHGHPYLPHARPGFEYRYHIFAPIVIQGAPRSYSVNDKIRVTGGSRGDARAAWREACGDWKKEIYDNYDETISLSCGGMSCGRGPHGFSCWSSAHARVRN